MENVLDLVKMEGLKILEAAKSQEWDMIVTNKGVAVGLGLFTHMLLSQGEPDFRMYLVIPSWVAIFVGLSYLLVTTESVSTVSEALTDTGIAFVTYYGTILTSMILYRVFFHRLRKFPGPFMARITKFYSVSITIPKIRYFLEVEKLHQKYGDYVRLGPRELSIADVNAIPLVHGVTSKCTKGPWYGAGAFIEGFSLHTSRDKQNHKERRRIWDRAFNTKSLHEYEPRIMRHTAQLLQQLKERVGQTVRLSDWVNFYSFDVMGDIGFSRSFGMLEKGTEDKLIKSLHASMLPLGLLREIPWFTNLFLRVPFISNDLKDFMRWTSNVLKERKKITPAEKDIFGYLLDPNEEGIPQHLNADTRLVIVAGSDTTASTLTWLFYELCKDQTQLRKLQKAVDEVAADKDLLSPEDVANIPILDGAINETLRIHPAVPSGVQRETPPEGIHVGDKYIPGNTIIWMPIHTIQRDSRYFPKPLEFMPERWTTRPEYVADKRAFLPFSTGTYKCIGLNLAMMEMRAVCANVIRNFDLSFAPTEDRKAIEERTRDTFTLTMGKLDVLLMRRKHRKDSVI